MCSPKQCTLYSLSGILFLLFVYILLSTQPFYTIGGDGAKNDSVDKMKSSALGGMIVFGFLFVISISWRRLSLAVACLTAGRSTRNGGGVQYELIDSASESTAL